MTNLSIKELPYNKENLTSLQKVLEEAPDYAHKITGLPVPQTSAQTLFDDFPEDANREDHLIYGLFLEDCMIGCAAILRHYPKKEIFHVGLLLLSEKHQGKGYGRKAYTLIEKLILSQKTCKTLRLGVVKTNKIALPFWKKMGFEETGQIIPYKSGTIESEIVVFEKKLPVKTSLSF